MTKHGVRPFRLELQTEVFSNFLKSLLQTSFILFAKVDSLFTFGDLQIIILDPAKATKGEFFLSVWVT